MTPLKNLKVDWKHVCDKPSVKDYDIGHIYTCATCGNHWKVTKAPWSVVATDKVWKRVALLDKDW